MHDTPTTPLPGSWLTSRLGVNPREIEELRKNGELFAVRGQGNGSTRPGSSVRAARSQRASATRSRRRGRSGSTRRASWRCCAARSASSAAVGCSTCASRAGPTSSSTPSTTPQRPERRPGPAYAGHVRILLVSQMYPGPDAPDLGTFVAQVERELVARGHELELAVLDTRAGGKLRYLTLARRARAASRPDVVYAHFLVPSCLIAALAGRAPLVVTAHGRDVRNIGAIPGVAPATRFVVRRAAAVICVSDYLRRALETKLPEPRGTVEVVSSGVDRERFAVTEP